MTTYILHGGNTKIDSVSNDLFYKQFTDIVPKDYVKILLCYWAREKNEWNERFEVDKVKILKQATKKVEINIVDPVDNLFTQLKDADVLYMSGGDEEYLRPYMSQLTELKDTLKDKVYIGSSMGAFLPSRHYVLSLDGQDTDIVFDGLGLIPYSVLCHWDIEENKDKKISMLKEKDPQTKTLLLEEEKFITLSL